MRYRIIKSVLALFFALVLHGCVSSTSIKTPSIQNNYESLNSSFTRISTWAKSLEYMSKRELLEELREYNMSYGSWVFEGKDLNKIIVNEQYFELQLFLSQEEKVLSSFLRVIAN